MQTPRSGACVWCWSARDLRWEPLTVTKDMHGERTEVTMHLLTCIDRAACESRRTARLRV